METSFQVGMLIRRVRALALLSACALAFGCASMLGDINPVLMAVTKEDANRVREAARLGETYEDGTPKIDGSNVCGERGLHLAVQQNNVEITRILLQEGADPDLPSEVPREPSLCESLGLTHTPAGYPPLHYAISTARPRIAEALLMGGADPMLTTPAGQNAADLARGKAGLEELVAYMESPLHLGAKTGDLGKLREAVDRGAEVDGVLPVVGTTALEEALLSRRWYVVDFLLQHGAGSQSTVAGDDVLDAAAEYAAAQPDSPHTGRVRALQDKPVR